MEKTSIFQAIQERKEVLQAQCDVAEHRKAHAAKTPLEVIKTQAEIQILKAKMEEIDHVKLYLLARHGQTI